VGCWGAQAFLLPEVPEVLPPEAVQPDVERAAPLEAVATGNSSLRGHHLSKLQFCFIFFQIASDCFPNMFSSGRLELLDGFGMFGMFGFKDWNLAAAKSRGALEHKGCNATVL
jgi:hypothetical protein